MPCQKNADTHVLRCCISSADISRALQCCIKHADRWWLRGHQTIETVPRPRVRMLYPHCGYKAPKHWGPSTYSDILCPKNPADITVLFRQLGHVTFLPKKKLLNFGRPHLLNAWTEFVGKDTVGLGNFHGRRLSLSELLRATFCYIGFLGFGLSLSRNLLTANVLQTWHKARKSIPKCNGQLSDCQSYWKMIKSPCVSICQRAQSDVFFHIFPCMGPSHTRMRRLQRSAGANPIFEMWM